MKQGLQLPAQVCPSICLNRLFATLRASFNSSYSVVVAHSCIRNGKAGVQSGYGLLIGLEHGHTTLWIRTWNSGLALLCRGANQTVQKPAYRPVFWPARP
jgi:hypothetical protein